MLGLYVDECVHGSVMCLGGIIVDSRYRRGLVQRFETLKEKVSYGSRILPLKWSLGDNDVDEREAKKLLKRSLGDRWLSEVRTRVVEFLGRENILLISVGMQAVQRGAKDPIVFYERGIRFLLQRLCFVIKERKSKHNYLVLDTPPREKARQAYEVYQQAYWRGFTFSNRRLAPLMESSVDCLYCSSSRHSPTLQLADFWAGLVGTWSKNCLDKPSSLPYYERLMKAVFSNIYGQGHDKFGYGLVFVPGDSKLRSQTYKSFLECCRAGSPT